MTPIDPPIRVGQAIAPVAPSSPTIAFDRRLAPGSLSLGQEVGARVLADRAGGRFVALIEGRPVEVVLPKGARNGDTLRLTVTAEQPRLVLSAPGEAGTGSGATGSTRASVAGAASLAGLPGLPGGLSAAPGDVTVSAGGRALSQLVGEIARAALQDAGDGGAADAKGLQGARGPLVADPAQARGALAGQLAAALARTFSGSGLFYESHQAQWVAGERSLESLRQEPQGRLAPLPGGGPSAAGADAAVPRGPTADAGRPSASTLRESVLPPAAPAGPAGAGVIAGVVDASAAGLVHQQLAALDAGSAGWAGLVLPGMQARITVQERPPPSEDEADAESGPGTDWSTRLAVVLPRLGEVDARLVLRGDRLLLTVAAGAADSAGELDRARQDLVDALAAAGLTVESLQVALR